MSEIIRTPTDNVHIFNIGRWSNLQADFAKVYSECFGEPPYNETYTYDWIIENVYNKHLSGLGTVLVALKEGVVVGLACAEKIVDDTESSPYKYLFEHGNLPFNLERACYISEVAVRRDMRRKGIGAALLQVLCSWGTSRGLTHYTARTAAEGSHSLGIFRRELHASILDGVQHVEGAEGEVPSDSKDRVYVWGKLETEIESTI